MKIPKQLKELMDDGLVDEVLRQLMSGKEATIFIVRSGAEIRCAKVYKDAAKRSFKKAVQYREGRHVRNSRRGRAMAKGSKFGKQEQEEIWQNAEADALFLLAQAGVRVPKPYGCFDGVMLMELITDAQHGVAPRLNDITMPPEQARKDHATVMTQIVKMLCAGIVHGDLSEFNVLQDEFGPVIIDLPQAVNAAGNNNAQAMLARDVNNMTNYYGRFAPDLLKSKHAKEIWALYEAGTLTPDTQLTGRFKESKKKADVKGVLGEVEFAAKENQERLRRLRERELLEKEEHHEDHRQKEKRKKPPPPQPPMKSLLLFTDGSAHPRSRIGYGAYLAIPDLNPDFQTLETCVKVKRFENTSSSQLEVEVLLWALRATQPQTVTLYTDCQNIIGLPDRRERLEKRDYRSKAGILLKHAKLYQEFFALTDPLKITLVKVKGHRQSHHKSQIERLFTLVDRASRQALRAELANQ